MSKIYSESGYINWDYLYPECRFIMAVTGSRGTGKTYGLLKYVLDHDISFLYLRRLKSQLDECVADAKSNPYAKINQDTGSDVRVERRSGKVRFTAPVPDSNERRVIGYGAALSTMATIRGADFSSVNCIVFDEYIAMKGERPIPSEARAFRNLIETVNRNRELEGHPPVKIFMLGNANKLMNPYYLDWHFMKTALRMIRGGQMVYRTPNNNRIMIMLLKSPISERKKETALYQDADDSFFGMAIENAFDTDQTTIKAYKLTDCRHIVSIGSIGIYQTKSDGKHYISETTNKSNYFPENEINLKLFQTRYAGLKTLYLYGYCVFENYDCELLFREYIGL